MLTTIIYAHPYDGSFNGAILDTVTESLRHKNSEYSLIDLYKDNFNPVLSVEELEAYGRGEYKDPLVAKYNEILDQTGKIILIFPIWWYDFPAILKGFFDKVMLLGSAYSSDDDGLHPLRDIAQTLIITTSSAATTSLTDKFGDTVNRMMIESTFKAIGFNGGRWENFGRIDKSTDEQRKDYLTRISDLA